MSIETRLMSRTLAIITKYGPTATFQTVAVGQYTPGAGTVSKPTAIPVLRKVSPLWPFEESLIDGTTVLQGDAQSILPASGLTFTPKIGMVLVLSAVQWTIVNFTPINVRETTIAYQLHLRK
jgi:hypothetical protein